MDSYSLCSEIVCFTLPHFPTGCAIRSDLWLGWCGLLLTVCRSMGSATTFRQLIFISILNFQEEGMPLFWHTLCFCCASYLFSSMVAKAGADRFSTGVVWWCQSMPEAPWHRAECASVLCGKYSSTLRRVQFGTPQGVCSFSSSERPEMRLAFRRSRLCQRIAFV